MDNADVTTTSGLVRTSLDSSRFGWGKLIVTFFFFLLSLILIGLPFLIGYIFRVIQKAANGNEETPSYSGDIFKEGLRSILDLLPIFMIMAVLVIIFESVPLISAAMFVIYLIPLPGIITSYSLTRDYKSLYPSAWWTFVKSKTYIYGLILFLPIAIFLYILVRVIPIGVIILLPYAILASASYWGFIYHRWDQTRDNQ